MSVEAHSDGRQLTALATPIAMTQLAQVAVSTTNIALMGSLGVNQVAAGGLALVLFNQIRTMCVGLITATGNQVATAVSRSEKRNISADNEIRDVVRASLLISTVAGIAGAAAGHARLGSAECRCGPGLHARLGGTSGDGPDGRGHSHLAGLPDHLRG